MCVLKNVHMKKLVLFLATVSLATTTQAQLPNCPDYSFQFGYTNYINKGQTNLQGFRVAFWPREYRYNGYSTRWQKRGAGGTGWMANTPTQNPTNAERYGWRSDGFCYPNNRNVGIFVDGIFTPTDSVKSNQYQALLAGVVAPIFDPSINAYIGFGNKWNSATGDERVSQFVATYGLSFIFYNQGLTLSLGRQNATREIFSKEGASTTIGIGYTFRRQ